MSDHANGALKKPQLSSFTESSPALRQKAPTKNSPSTLATLFSLSARLLLWYTILTALLRCPGSESDITDESPRICKSYLQLRSQAAPYVQPYYDQYLKPYADRAQPHVENFNAKVLTPATIFAKDKYDVFGAPRVAQLQEYAEGTWSSTIKPRLETRRKWAANQYEVQLAPYVSHVEKYAGPYLKKVREEYGDLYDETFVPLYERTKPYALSAYQQGHYAATEVVFPIIQSAQRTIFDLLGRNVWPTLIILYGENVEPQLTKITERLGRYKDSRRLQAAVDQVDSTQSINLAVEELTTAAKSMTSSVSPTASSSPKVRAKSKTASRGPTLEPIATPGRSPSPEKARTPSPEPGILVDPEPEPQPGVIEESVQPEPSTPENIAPSPESPSSEPPAEQVDSREKIEAELENWKQKFALATEKGTVDLKLRVGEITTRQIENQAHGTGKALVVQLEETVKTQTEQLRAHILSYVRALPEADDKKAEDAAYDKIMAEVRNAGSAIKERATAIRSWENSYDTDTTALVDAALESTLRTVDAIRDLGLQQIGMRWANMEGITYKDWSTYHDLKTDFDGSRQNLQDSALKHEGLAAARSEGDNVREAAMKEAQAAVAELVRLRDVGKWKIAARDTSDDFTSKAGIPPQVARAAAAAKKAADAMSSGVFKGLGFDGANEDDADDYTDVIESVNSLASSVCETASASGKGLLSAASNTVVAVESSVSSAIVGTPAPPAPESLSSSLSSGASSLPSVVSSATNEAIASIRVPGGVMAADPGSIKEIIWDTPEEGTFEQIRNAASSKYDQAVSLAKEQYSKASVAVAGTPKPKYEKALSSLDASYSASLSVASVKLASLLAHTASITSPLAKQTRGAFDSISSVASARLQQGLKEASSQYENAKSAVGAQPAPVHQQYLAEAQKQYYAGIGYAHDQYSRFLTAASTGVYGMPTPAYESLLSAAKAQYTGAVGAAQSLYDDALKSGSSIVGKTSKSPAQSMLDAASSQYEAAKLQAADALSAASASASSVFYGTGAGNAEYYASAASAQILGTQTPWTEAMASQASANWEGLIASASAGIYGTPTPWYQPGYSQAGDYAAQATAAAAAQYAQLSGLLGELIVGKEPAFTDSVLARLSSAYYTGAPNVASSASSVASEVYASASSVVASIFTPPATLEAILSQASDQLNSAVDAASAGIYGTTPGYIEQASSAAAGAASKASTAVYGTPPSYLESFQASFADIGSNANKAISEAFYGTPTGTFEAATSGAASVASSVSSVAAEHVSKAGDAIAGTYSAASVKVSEAIYGPEKPALESAQSRVLDAIKSASARLESLAAQATGTLGEGYSAVKSQVEAAASSVSSAAAGIKDEL